MHWGFYEIKKEKKKPKQRFLWRSRTKQNKGPDVMEEQGTEHLLHENKEEQGTEQCTLIDFHPWTDETLKTGPNALRVRRMNPEKPATGYFALNRPRAPNPSCTAVRGVCGRCRVARSPSTQPCGGVLTCWSWSLYVLSCTSDGHQHARVHSFWRDSSLALHKGEKPSILYKHLFDLYLGIITVIYSRKQGLRFWLDSRKKRFEAWKIGCLDSGFLLFWRRVIERRKRERELVVSVL